jgi:hypothetical protein
LITYGSDQTCRFMVDDDGEIKLETAIDAYSTAMSVFFVPAGVRLPAVPLLDRPRTIRPILKDRSLTRLPYFVA